MKIQYCSDLHIEFRANFEYLRENPIEPIGDILILAGDILPLTLKSKSKYAVFFDYLSDNFKEVYWVPGNHEFYGSDMDGYPEILEIKIRHNVHVLNNMIIESLNSRLILTSLWTQIGEVNRIRIQNGMSDFHAINYNGKSLTVEQYNSMHESSIEFLKKALENNSLKTTIASHHIPTFKNYPAKYGGDVLNEAFAVELSDIIEDSLIDCWVFGHHHENIPEFKIGNTRMLTNQLGYVKYGENLGYRSDAVFDNL